MNNQSNIESQSTAVETGFRLEARVNHERYAQPVQLQDGILTEKWRRVDVAKLGIVLPPDSAFQHTTAEDLMSFATAMSVAWGIAASCPHAGVEVRLVRYLLTTTHKLTRESIVRSQASPVIGGEGYVNVAEDEPAPPA
jgi:hypothetical protein